MIKNFNLKIKTYIIYAKYLELNTKLLLFNTFTFINFYYFLFI